MSKITDWGSSFVSLRGTKTKKVKELKVGCVILALGKKAKIVSIKTAEVTAPMKGLSQAPIKETLYIVDYKLLDDQLKDTGMIFQSTFVAGDSVLFWPEKKPIKFGVKGMAYGVAAGLLVGMSSMLGILHWIAVL